MVIFVRAVPTGQVLYLLIHTRGCIRPQQRCDLDAGIVSTLQVGTWKVFFVSGCPH